MNRSLVLILPLLSACSTIIDGQSPGFFVVAWLTVIALIVVLILLLNISYRRERAKMTPEQRAQEDEELKRWWF